MKNQSPPSEKKVADSSPRSTETRTNPVEEKFADVVADAKAELDAEEEEAALFDEGSEQEGSEPIEFPETEYTAEEMAAGFKPAMRNVAETFPWKYWADRTGDDTWLLTNAETDAIADALVKCLEYYLPMLSESEKFAPATGLVLVFSASFFIRYSTAKVHPWEKKSKAV